ncbi:MAG: putative sulfate exporter family transporter [Candidatus Omnitrophota bacterium]
MKNKNIILLAVPGIIIAFSLSYLGNILSKYHPLLDGFFIAFIGGIIVSTLIRKKTLLWTGTALCKDILIPVGLFLYGTQINWLKWAKLDAPIFFISIINIFLYFIVIFLCNRYLFGINNNKLSFLNSGANSICGVSATAVYIPFVDADEEETTATLLTIVITGLISVFSTWYIIQNIAILSSNQYAALCGLTLNQTGAVKAAASFMSKETVGLATTIKFFRTSLIIPVAFLIMFLNQKNTGSSGKMSSQLRRSAINYGVFIGILFFGGSLLFTFTPLSSYAKPISPLFKILFGSTLASVGLLCDLRKILKKEIIFNTISSVIGWIVVAVITLLCIKIYL